MYFKILRRFVQQEISSLNRLQICKQSLEKDVENVVSKQIFAPWQAILSPFDFEIECIQGKDTSLLDFLTGEFLQVSFLTNSSTSLNSTKENKKTLQRRMTKLRPQMSMMKSNYI